MDEQLIRELRQKCIQNPPEGMTPALVRNMTDSPTKKYINSSKFISQNSIYNGVFYHQSEKP